MLKNNILIVWMISVICLILIAVVLYEKGQISAIGWPAEFRTIYFLEKEIYCCKGKIKSYEYSDLYIISGSYCKKGMAKYSGDRIFLVGNKDDFLKKNIHFTRMDDKFVYVDSNNVLLEGERDESNR